MKLSRLAATAALVVLAGWAGVSWYTSPQRQIGRQLRRIQRLVSKAPGEDNLTALAKARSAIELFASRFEFEAAPFDFHTRDRQRLISAIQQYRSRAEAILVQFPEREVSVEEEQRRATSLVTAQLITRARDLSGREAYRLQINWLLEDGRWRIDYVRLLEILEDPPRSWIP